jgi:hypothetical protein
MQVRARTEAEIITEKNKKKMQITECWEGNYMWVNKKNGT